MMYHKRAITNSRPTSTLYPLSSILYPRRALTLVEMLVAMALTLFIMVILSTAFSTGIESFSQLKAIGDAEENLRSAATALRTDLGADHFEGKRRTSDPDLYFNRPREGFLRIALAGQPADEDVDPTTNQFVAPADGIKSFRSTLCVLHLTAKRRGNNPQDYYSAVIPTPAGSPLFQAPDVTNFFGQPIDARLQPNPGNGPGIYTSQWAEVGYFLVQIGTTTDPGNPAAISGTPLFALYRVERVVVPDNKALNAAAIPATPANQLNYAQMSWVVNGANPGTLVFNNPSDLTIPARRSFFFGGVPGNLTVPAGYTLNTTDPSGLGATLVATNVVSFQVRVLRTVPITPDMIGTNQAGRYAFDQDFQDLGFDSSDTTTAQPAGTLQLLNNGQPVQMPAFISAVAVTLRVWDQKTQQTRQITVTQDM